VQTIVNVNLADGRQRVSLEFSPLPEDTCRELKERCRQVITNAFNAHPSESEYALEMCEARLLQFFDSAAKFQGMSVILPHHSEKAAEFSFIKNRTGSAFRTYDDQVYEVISNGSRTSLNEHDGLERFGHLLQIQE